MQKKYLNKALIALLCMSISTPPAHAGLRDRIAAFKKNHPKVTRLVTYGAVAASLIATYAGAVLLLMRMNKQQKQDSPVPTLKSAAPTAEESISVSEGQLAHPAPAGEQIFVSEGVIAQPAPTGEHIMIHQGQLAQPAATVGYVFAQPAQPPAVVQAQPLAVDPPLPRGDCLLCADEDKTFVLSGCACVGSTPICRTCARENFVGACKTKPIQLDNYDVALGCIPPNCEQGCIEKFQLQFLSSGIDVAFASLCNECLAIVAHATQKQSNNCQCPTCAPHDVECPCCRVEMPRQDIIDALSSA